VPIECLLPLRSSNCFFCAFILSCTAFLLFNQLFLLTCSVASILHEIPWAFVWIPIALAIELKTSFVFVCYLKAIRF
jgi:hypothetical protein